MEGWIKLHRRMEEWEWYKDDGAKSLFIHLLLRANHKDRKWQGIEVKRGQTVTSRQSLADQLGKTTAHIRHTLKKLIATNEVTVTTTNKYSVITIVNYNSYNDKEDDQRPAKRPTKQPSNDQQSDTPATTNNNDKNVKNEKEVKDMCDFDEVWNALPARNNKKLEKPAAFTRYKQQALKDRPAILIAAKNYANSDLVKRGIGIKDPKRFLLNWQDWKEAETGKHTTTNLTEDEIDKALGLK